NRAKQAFDAVGNLGPAFSERHRGPALAVGAVGLFDLQVLLVPAVFERKFGLEFMVSIAVEGAERHLPQCDRFASVESEPAILKSEFYLRGGLPGAEIR